MEKIAAETLDELIQAFVRLRRHQPFRYSGTHYLAVFPGGEGRAYRTEKGLLSALNKVEDLPKEVEIAIIK